MHLSIKSCFLIILLPFVLFANTPKKALIFGITGQDGYYLSTLLLEKGYEVHGVSRRFSSSSTPKLDALQKNNSDRFFLHNGDLTDGSSIVKIMQATRPDEIYNLGAQSVVTDSFDVPEYTAEVNAMGVLRILEGIKHLDLVGTTKYFQASTSELFDNSELQQNFHPRSPYAISKLFAYWITVNYRETYGIFASNGILFNHESPFRGDRFVTRKITQAAARIKLGIQDVLLLGNLDVKKDWGYAKDHVEAIWEIMQQKNPGDFVLATEELHTVREFVEHAFHELDIEIVWRGQGIAEEGIDKKTQKIMVKVDPAYFRPFDNDPTKRQDMHLIKWKTKTNFEDLVKLMVVADFTNEINLLNYRNYKENGK